MLALIAAASGFARADDYGPRGDIRELRFVAPRLLAQRARAAGVDPKTISVPDVVVVADSALLSWNYGMRLRPNTHGVMGLVRREARWWDALDDASWDQSDLCWNTSISYPLQPASGARGISRAIWVSYGLPAELVDRASQVPSLRSAIVRPIPSPSPRNSLGSYLVCPFDAIYATGLQPKISRTGGIESLPRSLLSGYDITIHYTPNTADGSTHFAQLYARPPTQAEIIPYPTIFNLASTPTSVAYFDLRIDGPKPVTFAPGTTIDIWFPFVLDDSLSYDLTIGFAQQPIGPIAAKPYDNVLHYKLPGFTAMPGQTLMAEVDGDWP